MTRRPRLLIAVNDPAFFLSHRLPIAKAAARHGYEVHVATPEEPDAELVRAEGFRFHPLPLKRHGTNPLSDLLAFRAFFKLFRDVQPDLVHLVTIKPVLYGGIAARMARVPAVVSAISGVGFVFSSRGFKAALFRFFVRRLYRFAVGHPNGRVIFQNPDDRDLFVRSAMVKENSCVLIRGSGVSLEVFQPVPEPDGPPAIILAARMLWDKGIGEFVEAARILKRRGKRARFCLAGLIVPGSPVAVPLCQVLAWQEEGLIEWLGFRTDMPEVMARSHIACLPSYREGLPKVLIEAAAAGRPVVATDVPGCREIVRAGENGLLVPSRNAELLADALARLVDSPEERIRMGLNGRKLVQGEFEIDSIVKDTLSVYRDLRVSPTSDNKGALCI